jgi:hypothetical protein
VDEERSCGSFLPELAKATRSHHFKVLREAGLTRTRVEGTSKYVRLRTDLADRFPGLLDSVLAADTVPVPADVDPLVDIRIGRPLPAHSRSSHASLNRR